MLEEKIRIVPRLYCPITQAVGGRLGATEVREVKPRHTQRVLDVCHYALLNCLGVSALILAHELPYLFVLEVIDLVLQVLGPVQVLAFVLLEFEA